MIVAFRLIAMSLLIFQLIMIILYAVFVNYPTVITEPATTYASYYSYTLNVAVMVLLGFGLIMTYLRSHSWSASAFSLLIVVLTMQYYILWNFFWSSVASNQFNRYVEITQEKIIRSLFASTAVLVSYGTVLGRVGPFEVFIMVIVQIIGYSCNQMLCSSTTFLNCFDVGGGMQIHTYGAVFGIIVSMYLSKEGLANNLKQTSSYTTTIISFIGTLFLWIYWPSFNSALAVDTSDVTIREVASTNTVFALMASTLAAFIFSMMYNHKLNIRDIAFASLSGAVVIASCANIIINIGGVMLIAFFTGWIATSGYVYLSRYLQIYGFHDTTGTVNLFFIPGLLSGIFSSVLIAIYATAPKYLNIITTYADRTSYTQGGYQLACLGTTIGFAIAFGIIGGLILCRLAVYHKEELFEDRTYWELIQDEQNHAQPLASSHRQHKYMLELTNRIDDHFIKSPLTL